MANYGHGKILTLRYLLFLQENGAYLDYCICAMCRIPHYVKGFDCNKAPRSIVGKEKRDCDRYNSKAEFGSEYFFFLYL